MKSVRVLLVEDNAGDALLVDQALKDCPIPVKLTIARDGEQALSLLSERGFEPDLIILDLNIPKIPGHVLLQRFDAKTKPIVVFSAYWDDVDLDRVFALGVREYVHKPTDLDAFKTAVCGMIQKWALHPRDRGSIHA
jgi:CheY-like chemotaxis protein